MTDETILTPSQRRAQKTAEIRSETGIDEAMIESLVHTFYGHVRQDPMLGPIFESRISDWGPHLQRMCAFWSSVALQSGVYHGQPMPKHLPLPIDARHFDRWISLFSATAKQVCPPKAAEVFIERAGRIAQSLEMGLAAEDDVILLRGRRHIRPDAMVFLPEDMRAEPASSPCSAHEVDPAYMGFEGEKE